MTDIIAQMQALSQNHGIRTNIVESFYFGLWGAGREFGMTLALNWNGSNGERLSITRYFDSYDELAANLDSAAAEMLARIAKVSEAAGI